MAAPPQSQATPSTENPQERTARQYLAQGRFRKARDEFKLLCKVDRAKFLPLLVEANIGLAREMLSKGLVSEAREVVAYLKTIAPADLLLSLELEVGGSSVKEKPALAQILSVLPKPALSRTERQRLADQAVLAWDETSPPSAQPAALAGELASIWLALRAVCQRRFAEALDLVRPLGQASVFAHWKLFVKGLAAFHGGEAERAARFFAGLPAGSLPAQASRAWLLLLGAPPSNREAPLPSQAVVEAACRMAGQAGCGGALLRAEQAWRKQNPRQMYQALREGIAQFPCEGPDFLGLLSEFLVNCFFGLPPELKDDFASLAEQIIDRGRFKNLVELALMLRMTVQAMAPSVPDAVLISFWRRYLQVRAQLHGANPALDAMALGWLGRVMSQPPPPFFGPFGMSAHAKSRMRNAHQARQLLEESVSLDRENLDAHLCLCEVYKELGEKSQRNKLLDGMSARFPSEKKVLLSAAEGCLERKSYKKGTDYILQALAVDRLDPAIGDMFVKACLLQARESFQKQHPWEARKTLERTAAYGVETPGNLRRSRWCLKIQQAILECAVGDKARGQALMSQARQESPSVAAALFYAAFSAVEWAPHTPQGWSFFIQFEQLGKAGANAAQALLLTRIWAQGRELGENRLQGRAGQLLDNYLRAAAKHPFAREDASRLVEFALTDETFFMAGQDFVEQRLRQDCKDPLFRLYRLQFSHRDSGLPSTNDRAELEEILAEAIRRKEDQTVRQARQQLDALDLPPPMPAPPFEEEPFEDEEDFDDGPPSPVDLLGSLPPAAQRMMEEMIEMLSNASERDLGRMRSTLPPGMSPADFDLMVELARSRAGLPEEGPWPKHSLPPPAPRAKFPPKPDRNQMDLF